MKILNCPICKNEPKLEVRDLGRPNGRGYQGCESYTYTCPKCDMVKASADTIYTNKDIVNETAIKYWNEEVNRILELMGRGLVDKKEVRLFTLKDFDDAIKRIENDLLPHKEGNLTGNYEIETLRMAYKKIKKYGGEIK